MIPLLPFIAGLALGAAAMSALRGERARAALEATGARLRGAVDAAESGVRAAARGGLAIIRRGPHGMPDGASDDSTAANAADLASEPAPTAKPARTRKRAAAGQAAKPPRKAKASEV